MLPDSPGKTATACDVSVVVCTHNPRPAVLAEVIDHLHAQSLDPARWELIVVDNASDPAVGDLAVRVPAACRIMVEPEPGLTRARIRGITEARGGLIVFVDDDNLLDRDYLKTAVGIAARLPRLGAFGGRISPRLEVTPPEWLRPFRGHLAIVEFDADAVSERADRGAIVPCGAGLCVRREAALAYAELAAADPRRLGLDRTADAMTSCGDTDLVFTCLDQGWATGRFVALHLTHVIPAERLTLEYHLRLARGIGYSCGRLEAIRGHASTLRIASAWLRTLRARLGILHRGPVQSLEVATHEAFFRGLRSLGPRGSGAAAQEATAGVVSNRSR